MTISKDQLFSEDTPSYIIPGFPYTERNCIYCERSLLIWKAFHIRDEPEHYKAVMICNNQECGSYDEEAKDAYCRVYYSSQYAYDILSLSLIKDPRSIYLNLRKE